MKLSLGLIVFTLSSICTAQQPATAPRVWTSADGNKIEATLLGVDGASVRIKLATGVVYTLPITRLSAADQAFVKSIPSAAAPAEKSWPRSVALDEPPQPKIVVEDAAKKEFVYRSEHYEFRCDSKLGANVVREFCRIFEATYTLNCKLPLDLKPAPEPGQDLFVAKLYTNKEDYMANGGITGSAGVYQSGQKALSVPLSSLGVKMVGNRVSLERTSDDDNTTLIHEITHQMMNHWLGKLRTWYVEGSAEAVEMLDYERGKFSLIGLKQRLQNYLRRMGSDGKNFVMLDPEELFSLNGATWSAALSSLRGQATQNYASACLMTYYFYYLDGNEDGANIIAYLRELENAGRNEEEAAFKKHLLRERSMDTFKSDLKKAFRKEGVDLTFAPAGKNNATSAP